MTLNLFTLIKKAYTFFAAPFDKDDLPRVPWTPKDGLKMISLSALVLIAISYGGFFIGVLFTDLYTMSKFVVENMRLVMIGGLIIQVLGQIFFLFLFSARKYKISIKNFGFRKTNIKIISFVVIALTIFSIIFQNSFLMGLEQLGIAPMANSVFHEIVSENVIPLWFLFIFVVGVAPFLEELVFRGFLIPAFLKNMSPTWAIVASGFLFAVAHLQLTLLPVFFVMGVLLGIVYLRTKSLLPGIAFHAVNNCLALSLLVFA